MAEKRRIGIGWIITGFALLHAAATIICRSAGVSDDIWLTILTIALTLIICFREGVSLELTAINIILVNIVGYGVGMGIAKVLRLMTDWGLAVPAISTFLTTEAIGWALMWFISIFKTEDSEHPTGISELSWLAAAIGAILLVRIILQVVINSKFMDVAEFIRSFSDFVSNTIVVLTMIVLTILFIQYIRGNRVIGRSERFIITTIFIVGVTFLSALMVGYGLPFKVESFSGDRLIQLFLSGGILEITIFAFTYLIIYSGDARREMTAEKKAANMAKSQYINLKQQVNPHFLFNSLNVLDCLVADGKEAESREYIHKLSSLYRYMLGHENESLTLLSDEMKYAGAYSDLMKVRFPDGLTIETGIRDKDLGRKVVTFSVQMLIENATKHNQVSSSAPLHIKIWSDDKGVHVKNNLNPKLSEVQSTGLGLKYIGENYKSLTGQEINIEDDGKDYCVTLPFAK
jgi:hypothetical protein